MHARRQQALFPIAHLAGVATSCRSGKPPTVGFLRYAQGKPDGSVHFSPTPSPAAQRPARPGCRCPTPHSPHRSVVHLNFCPPNRQSPPTFPFWAMPVFEAQGKFRGWLSPKIPPAPAKGSAFAIRPMRSVAAVQFRVCQFLAQLPRSTPATAVVITIAAITATTSVTPPCDDDDENEEGRRMNESLC